MCRPARRCTKNFRPWWKRDRKSTRLNSSHLVISYAVFCLKKKNKHALVAQVSQALATAVAYDNGGGRVNGGKTHFAYYTVPSLLRSTGSLVRIAHHSCPVT